MEERDYLAVMRGLAIMFLCGLAFAAPASAGPIRTSLTVAEKYWGQAPCEVQVVDTPLAPTWADDANGQAEPATCRIWINERKLTNDFAWVSRRVHRLQTCFVVVHEYGHLVGQQHSDDPRSIMFPGYHRWDGFRPCQRAFPTRRAGRRKSRAA